MSSILHHVTVPYMEREPGEPLSTEFQDTLQIPEKLIEILEMNPSQTYYAEYTAEVDEALHLAMQQNNGHLADAIRWISICATHIEIPQNTINQYLVSPNPSDQACILSYLYKTKNTDFHPQVTSLLESHLQKIFSSGSLSQETITFVSDCLLILGPEGIHIVEKYPQVQPLLEQNAFLNSLLHPTPSIEEEPELLDAIISDCKQKIIAVWDEFTKWIKAS